MKKVLKIDKGIYIATIHECTDTIYLIVGNSEVFTVLTVVSAAISKPLSPIQEDIILGFQYQYINLIGLCF